MVSKVHRSGSRRSKRSDGRQSNQSLGSASVTASTHPSISVGWTSSTSATTISGISVDSDPNPPPGQPLVPFFFDAQQMEPWEGHSLPPDHDLGSYWTSSPEPIDYGSPGNSDDLASSMYAAPGSPPAVSSSRSQRSTVIDESPATEHEKKRGSHTRDPRVVMSWRPNPRSISLTQGVMVGGYQAFSPYPPIIADADVHDQSTQGQGNVNLDNQDGRQYRAQEDDEDNWDMCQVDDSSCTRER